MDTDQHIQQLRDLDLGTGRRFITEHAADLPDRAAFGVALADEALKELYTPFLSLKLAELLIFFGDHVQHLPSHALGLKAKGDALVQVGHFQAAIDCLDQAGEEFLSLGDEGNWAKSRISWIVSSAGAGNIDNALQQAAQAREAFSCLGEYYWACVIDHNTAMIYDDIGKYEDAHRLYEQMLNTYSNITDQHEASLTRSIALAKMNQAIHVARFGDFERAYQLQKESRASFIRLNEISLVLYSEIHLADLNYIQGSFGSALRGYYQALDRLTLSGIDDPLLLAELKYSIANCLVKLHRTQEACRLANEAVELYRNTSESPNTGLALREYAHALLASGRSREALVALDEALAIFQQRGFDHYTSLMELQRAEFLLLMGFAAEAYHQAHITRKLLEDQHLESYVARANLVIVQALIMLARQLHETGERRNRLLRKAASLGKKALLQAQERNLQEEIYRSHHLLGNIFELQSLPDRSVREYTAAIAQIESILNDLAYDLSPAFLHATWTVYEDMIALCLKQSRHEQGFVYLEQARSMALRQYIHTPLELDRKNASSQKTAVSSQVRSATIMGTRQELKNWQEQYRYYGNVLAHVDPSVSAAIDRDIIEAEFKRCETKVSELFERLHVYQAETPLTSAKQNHVNRPVEIVSLTRLQQELLPGQLLLAYCFNKGNVVIFALMREKFLSFEIDDGVAQLERLFPFFHAHMQPEGWPDGRRPSQKGIRGLLKKLYDLLIAPVETILPPSGQLVIVPYGPLHEFPFHALYNGSQFLIEQYDINYLPASNLLTHFSSHRDGAAVSSMPARAPSFFGYSGNGYLQRCVEEATTLADMLGGRCFLEEAATIAHLIEQAPGCPIIHIATHGRVRLDAPNFSYVVLADGQLNAIDAFSLDLQNCELVTLSGCETGLSLIGGGDEQLGLGRAFLAAGARSLLISLWPVEDCAANQLMQIFYQRLLQGESKMQALRAAQCALLHSETSSYSHPYFWATFRLVGDGGPLPFSIPNSSITASHKKSMASAFLK